MLLLALCAAVLCTIFALASLPFAVMGYAGALCAAVVLGFGCVDFACFYSKMHRLTQLQRHIGTLLGTLPAVHDAMEEQYQQLLAALYDALQQSRQAVRSERRETQDYYSLWVHQIKTPIAALHLLLQTEDVPQREALGAELFRIEQYVEMVLSYLRLDSESNDLVLRQTDLDAVLRQTLRKMARLFIRSKISLQYTAVHAGVLTDEKWLAVVLEQVLTNAVKYTPGGSISIYMQDVDTLVIQDTGIGIAPEDLPRVCEKGFTGYNGRSSQKSSGLGLYLCSRICAMLGHTLVLHSTVGHGTEVHICMRQAETMQE